MEEPVKLPITEWAIDDRPREKLMMKGIYSLSSAELIAILIGSGNRDETAVELSQRILNVGSNKLSHLGKWSVKDFTSRFKGIGPAKAISIIAALEIGRRRAAEEPTDRPIIKRSEDIYRLMLPRLMDLPHEEFWIMLLTSKNRVIDTIKVSQGGLSTIQVDVRIMLKAALLQSAAKIVLCHNHPSNLSTPGREDLEMTRYLKQASEIIGIQIVDHVIVCENNFYSFADKNDI